MLNEYALEPSLLNNWRDFRFFVSHFGFDQGRLISKFPKRWKRMVYENLTECHEMERKRIEEALRRIDHSIVPRKHTWEKSLSWLQNAEHQHAQSPFHAIIAAANPNENEAVLIASEIDPTLDCETLDKSDSRRLWKAVRSRVIKRCSEEMAATNKTLLTTCQRLLLVDKHFGPENERHRKPFREFLRTAEDRDSALPSIEVHTSDKAEAGFFESECRNELAPLIPAGHSVRFVRWSRQDLHNRFLLTDRGGVAFLEGLDQPRGKGRAEDVVVLLDRDVAAQLLKSYDRKHSTFYFVDDYEVVGTRVARATRNAKSHGA